jgi:hypothetical protein
MSAPYSALSLALLRACATDPAPTLGWLIRRCGALIRPEQAVRGRVVGRRVGRAYMARIRGRSAGVAARPERPPSLALQILQGRAMLISQRLFQLRRRGYLLDDAEACWRLTPRGKDAVTARGGLDTEPATRKM